MKSNIKICTLWLLMIVLLLFTACGQSPSVDNGSNQSQLSAVNVENLPEFDGKTAYIAVNDNFPQFSTDELVDKSYEYYSPLDSLGRCGYAIACVGKDIMPTEERGSIGQVKPSGWHTVKYDNVDGKYLYNRCHLIGYQLTGENANELNLITGTRYLNIEGMLPFENMIADYVKETNNHVIYRVTPVFEDANLLASGVQMEAYSVEDNGEGICFNVYAYNSQPDIKIDYRTGKSEYIVSLYDKSESSTESKIEYVLNTNSKKIHLSTCRYVNEIKAQNIEISDKNKDVLIKEGYSVCKNCNP